MTQPPLCYPHPADLKIGDLFFDKATGRYWRWNGKAWKRLFMTVTEEK